MQKIFYRLQKIAYKKADVITAISEDMKVKLLEQGVPENKIKVIVNWYDDRSVREIPWSENRFVTKYSLDPGKFYVQYAGTMGTNFNPDIVLAVAELLKAEKNIVFQMIGDGKRRAAFEKEAAARGLDNIVFYPLQPQDMVSDVYSACSVCLIPLKEGVIGNSVPSKAALLMACGRVIINSVDFNSHYYRLFEEENIGFSVCNDSRELARIIVKVANDPKGRSLMEAKAKRYAEEHYKRSSNTSCYVELFKKLTS